MPVNMCAACPSNPDSIGLTGHSVSSGMGSGVGAGMGPGLAGLKLPTHQKVSLGKVFSLLVPESSMILLALGGITLSAGATMAFPNAIGQIIDILQATVTDEGVTTMRNISMGMVGIFAAGTVATFVHSSVLEIVGQRVGARLRKQMFQRIMSQEMAFFDQNRVGELANRLSTDVHEVAEHLVENVASFLENLVKAVCALAAMLWISPVLTLAASSIVPAVAGGAVFYGRFIKKLSKMHLDALAASTQIAAERFAAVRTVVSFGQSGTEVKRYNKEIDASYNLARKVALIQGSFMATSYMVGNAALLGVLYLGGNMVMADVLTAGTLASFCMYAGHLAVSVNDLTESISGFLRAQGSGARLFWLLEREPSDQSGALKLNDEVLHKASIKYENVTFAYPSSPNQKVLRNLSLEIKPGELIAITGRSGCGKSSMASLLERLYAPDKGRITIADIDINDFDANWLRSQIGSVLQEPILFAMSIGDNIKYGHPDATAEEIEEACRQAHIHDFITGLPEGYDTHVGERGLSLSGGQKQRIAVSRALLGNPRIVLFDEATSALDTESEAKVHTTLRGLVDDTRTVIVIAHHLSTLSVADKVIVIEDGTVAQTGTFNDLMQQEGVLHQLMDRGTIHAPHPSARTVSHGAHPYKKDTPSVATP